MAVWYVDDELETLSVTELNDGSCLCVGMLSDQTIMDCETDRFGLEGYFVFKVSDDPIRGGFEILAKTFCFESAYSLASIMRQFNLGSQEALKAQ